MARHARHQRRWMTGAGLSTSVVVVITSGLLAVMPATASVCPTPVAPSGDGAAGTPYLISSAAELVWVSATGDKSLQYQQTANIDLAACDFTPIGTEGSPFSGTYDGNSKTITGLKVTSAGSGAGLFGSVSGTVTNLGVSGQILGTADKAGLLTGVLNGGTITQSYSQGSVAGDQFVGGLVGSFTSGTISNSYSSASVTATSDVGGLVGVISGGNLSNTYASGAVSSGGTNVGGLVGLASSVTASGNYFNSTTTGQSASAVGNGLNTENFRVRANFSGFDFSSIWRIDGNANSGFPFLSWQNLVPTVASSVGTDFWTTFGDNSGSDSDRRLELYLSSESDTTATITYPSGTTEQVSLLAGVTKTLDVTTAIGQGFNQITEGITNNGVRVQSPDRISVYGIHYVRATTDAWVAIPTTSLGYDYMVNLPASGDSTQGASSNLQVVAAEPGITNVTITPTVNMAKRGGRQFIFGDNNAVTIDKATNQVTITNSSAAGFVAVGDTFYLLKDLSVDNGDVGFTIAAQAITGGERNLFRVAAKSGSTSFTFTSNVDFSSVSDTTLNINGSAEGIQVNRDDNGFSVPNDTPVTLDKATNSVTISSAQLSYAVSQGDTIYFQDDLTVDNGDVGFTSVATAMTGGANSQPNTFTVSAVVPGQSLTFVTNVSLANVTDTAVLINGSSEIMRLINPAGTPITVKLRQGQVYNLQVDRATTFTRTRDISGTTISSDRKTAVIVSSFFCCTPQGTSGAYDQTFEQLIPEDRWGTTYIMAHGPNGASSYNDTLKIVAKENSTVVNRNGTQIATLNRGETIQIAATKSGAGADLITADKPISLLHVTTGSSSYAVPGDQATSGDPAIAIVPPVSQYLNSYVITTPATNFRTNYATLIVKKTEKSQITRAGYAIGASSFTDIPNTDYAVARLHIALGTHYFRAPSGFLLQVAGYDAADSYSYPGGFGLVDPVAYPGGVAQLDALQTATRPISIGGDSISGTPNLCSTLTVAEGAWLDGRSAITDTSYQWLRNGLPINGATASTLSLAGLTVGDLISYEIKKTNAAGTTTAFSTPVAIVDNLLSGLQTTVGTLSPTFDPCTTVYSVSTIQDWLQIIASASQGTSLAIGATSILSDQASVPQTLTQGANTRTINVTRGGYTQAYTLNITYTAGPSVNIQPVSNLQNTTATVNASANANGNQLSAASFEYSIAADFSGSTTVNVTPPSGIGTVNFSANLTGLVQAQKYYLRATVTNSVGTVTSQVFEFVTRAAPQISSISVARDNTVETEIDFSATVTAFGSSTQLIVRYSLSADFSNAQDVNLGAPVSSTSGTTVSGSLTGLPKGSLIYYQLRVTNANGTNYGPLASFQLRGTPEIAPPEFTVGSTTVTIDFPVNPRGSATDLICISYSTSATTNATCTSPSGANAVPTILDGNEFQTTRATFTGLSPSTTYWVRATARNYRIPPTTTSQVATSPSYSFTTLSAAALTSSVEGPASVGPNDTILLTFRFSEDITGFDKTDVVLSGATTGWTTQPIFEVEPGLFIMEIRPTGTVTAPSTLTIDVPSPGTSSQGETFPATNSLSVAVVNTAPVISYAGSPFTFTQFSAITPANATVTGGTPATFTVTPTLPSGLSISNTGVISGTPTSSQGSTSYTVTANNAAGSGTATISIAVTGSSLQPPTITYPASTYSFERDQAITNVEPTLGGGTAASFSISPALPAGLTFNTSTAVISGTPTTFSTSKTYVVTASNGAGSSSFSLRIGTFEIAPSLSLANSSFGITQFAIMTPITPTNSGGAATYVLASGTLPSGLSLNSATGAISGTPGGTRLSADGNAINITIRAINSAGFQDLSFSIRVLLAPPLVSYAARTVQVNSSMTAVSPTLDSISGGVASYSISPALPTGLSLNTSTGAISGTPTAIPADPNFTITATNAAGFATAFWTLTVTNRTPLFTYSASYSANEQQSFSATPSITGGANITFTISPSLPSGLSINSSTGAITGTPAAGSAQSATSYTVTGTNSSGSLNRIFTITVTNVPVLAFSYPTASLSLTESTLISTQTPTTSAGTPNQWSISPALPGGMSINSSTGLITGTPDRGTRQSSTLYTITGGDGVSSNTFQISIAIAAKPISFTYATNTMSLSENEVISTNNVVPSNGSVSPLSFTVSPALPSGLFLNASTGAITGTPAVGSAQTSTTYTITGTDADLTATATILIVIVEQLIVQAPPQQPQQPQAPQDQIVSSGSYAGPIIFVLSKVVAKQGESLAAFGQNFDTVTHIEVAGIKIAVDELTTGRFAFDLPAGLPIGLHDIVVFSSFGKITHQSALRVEGGNQISVKRISFSGFTFNSPSLTSAASRGLAQAFDTFRTLERVTCIGTTEGRRATVGARRLALQRATQACAVVQKLNPSVEVTLRQAPASGLGSKFRGVQVWMVGAVE